MVIYTLLIGLMLAVIYLALSSLLRKVIHLIMATFAELSAALDSVQAGVDGLEAAIKDLKAQVAAGHVITQAELDSLMTKAQAINADIADPSDQG